MVEWELMMSRKGYLSCLERLPSNTTSFIGDVPGAGDVCGGGGGGVQAERLAVLFQQNGVRGLVPDSERAIIEFGDH